MTKQKTSALIHILAGLLILALIVSSVYFWNKARNAGYEITIGSPSLSPVMEDGREVEKTLSVDFTRSRTLKEKSQINAAIFSLAGADPIESPDLPEVPDAVMQIFDRETGIIYHYRLWLTENSIIFAAGLDADIRCRENKNAPELSQIVKQQMSAYGGGLKSVTLPSFCRHLSSVKLYPRKAVNSIYDWQILSKIRGHHSWAAICRR